MDITKKWFSGDAPVNAVYSTSETAFSVADAELVFTGKLKTVDYDGWKVNLVDPSDTSQELSVSVDVAGKKIDVSLATDAEDAITSKASDVKTAIEAHAIASTIIDVNYAADNDGSGVVKAFAGTLADGADGTVCQDVDVIVKDSTTGQYYTNILPNSRHDANWRKVTLTDY